jgi:hypothetical protein
MGLIILKWLAIDVENVEFSTVIFLNEIFITLVLQLIRALAVAKKGHPKITGI